MKEMNPENRNYRVIGNEIYLKTKVPILYENDSLALIEKAIQDFEDIFRHNYYVKLPRYVK